MPIIWRTFETTTIKTPPQFLTTYSAVKGFLTNITILLKKIILK